MSSLQLHFVTSLCIGVPGSSVSSSVDEPNGLQNALHARDVIGAELRRRLRDSRQRVNALIAELSVVLRSVDYADAPPADLSWLADSDDRPIMLTALAARADTLVTDNSSDFPLGEERNGILILGSPAFLATLFRKSPEAETAIAEFLRGAQRDATE
jgi:hypothetical protein